MARKTIGGYSLSELLMTLVLASTIMMLGVPSFTNLIADQRMRSEADALFHGAHLARKLSVVRRRAITLCASRDRETCSGGSDWSAGWILFEEMGSDGLGERGTAETLIRSHVAGEGLLLAANRSRFTFRATHRRATNGTIRLCAENGAGRARAIIISYTGRPRVAYEDRRGRNYDCT